MGDLKEAQNLLKELKKLSETTSASPEVKEKARQTLLQFKKTTSSFQYLPPSPPVVQGGNAKLSKAERTVAMQGYEYACIMSANRLLDQESSAMSISEREGERQGSEGRNEALERHVLLLRPFYFDYRKELGDSPKRYEIIGLELLALLVGQKLGDFYSLLERIPIQERDDKYIAYVNSLEEYLMEGNYNQLLSARKKSPSKLYKTLLGELEVTVRNEVASCIEQSYPKISIDAAAKLMNCKKEYVQVVADKRERWLIEPDGNIIFRKSEENNAEIPVDVSKDLVKETLNYAHELERIV